MTDKEFEAFSKQAVKKESPTDKERGFIDWWEFAPQGDTFIVHTQPDQTKQESESGIIFATEVDVVQDRPFKGEIVSVGPDATFKLGTYVYFEPQKGMDLAMIRKKDPADKYLLLYPEAILGIRVKDTRK